MIIYRNEHRIIRDSSDFRFVFLDRRFLGLAIFRDGEKKTAIMYKGKAVAEATFSCVRKTSFFLFARLDYKIHGQTPPVPIDNFKVDVNTKFLDLNHDWIYTGDLLLRVKDQEIYEVKTCPQSGEYYLSKFEHNSPVDYFTDNCALTDDEDYSIVGNKIEGVIDGTWHIGL